MFSTLQQTTDLPIFKSISSFSVTSLAAQSELLNCVPLEPMSSLQFQSNHQYENQFETVPVILKRAISCDSVCSDTSVALEDLEEVNITGYLCIGLEYER